MLGLQLLVAFMQSFISADTHDLSDDQTRSTIVAIMIGKARRRGATNNFQWTKLRIRCLTFLPKDMNERRAIILSNRCGEISLLDDRCHPSFGFAM
jgi:hypothetical protein